MGAVAALRQRPAPLLEQQPRTVEVTSEVRLRATPPEVRLLGVVISEESVDLATREAARVGSVRVHVGSEVHQGEVVLTLNTSSLQQELAMAQAALLSQQAELEVATLTHEQSQERLKRREAPEQLSLGAISQEELSTARYEERMAAAKLGVARARVQEQEARVAQIRKRLDDASLRAPFDGVVAGRFVHPGALVSAGQPLLHLLRRGKLQVRFAIPHRELQNVAPGRPVQVDVPERGLVLGGHVAQVAPEVDVASLMVFALADVGAEQGTWVPAGTTVRVKVLAEQEQARDH
jgi:RND family efflux transporter MFP subunit